MRKLQKTTSNISILTWERWINPESCTPKEITLAYLQEKQLWRGNTLLHITLKYYKNNTLNLSSKAYKAKTICVFNVTCWKKIEVGRSEIIESRHAKRVLRVILIKMLIFLFSECVSLILRLICEILSKIAVKISFLWGCKLCVYAVSSFVATDTSWYLRNDMQNRTSVILYMNIKCIAQCL